MFCGDCQWRTKCVVGSMPAQRLLPPIARLTLAPRQTLCREGEPFTSIYMTRSGTQKSLVTSVDGRQQIVAIHLPGEMLGADGLANGRRNRTVIAVEKSEVCMIGFDALDSIMRDEPAVQRWFRQALGDELSRANEAVGWLRRTSAEERIAAFLLDLSRRLSRDANSDGALPEFTLSASRVDIAFHLGLTRETVSRAFTKLRRQHLIDGDLNHVRLCDPRQLGFLAAGGSGCTNSRTRAGRGAPSPLTGTLQWPSHARH